MSESSGRLGSRLTAAFDWFFRERRSGRIVMWQWPNSSIGVFLVATAITSLIHPSGGWAIGLHVVATVALLWWASDEVLRGANPFRRTLGGLVAAWTLAGLVTEALN